MSLTINGTLQDTFSIDGVSLDNLYIDGVLVFTSNTYVRYSIRKDIDDYCEYDAGSGGCTTSAVFTAINVDGMENPTYSWVVTSATLDSGQGTDTITVTTPVGTTPIDYTVTLTATDIDGEVVVVQNSTATKVVAPIKITGISQDVSGSCDPI